MITGIKYLKPSMRDVVLSIPIKMILASDFDDTDERDFYHIFF